jgi:hypothetical protein
VFVDDVREFALDDGVYHEGGRAFVTTLVKASNEFASTGGWKFQAWKGGPPVKPIAGPHRDVIGLVIDVPLEACP